MTREEAARVLTELADEYEKYELSKNGWLGTTYIPAHRMGVAALRGLEWIKVTDELPEDSGQNEVLGLYKADNYFLYDIVKVWWLRLHPEMYAYWTYLPKKPEVEE